MKLISFTTSARLGFAALALLLGAQFGGAQTTDPWQALPQYRFGQSREPLATIEEQIRKSSPGEREKIEQRLLEALQSPSATTDSRRFICRWLGNVGSEKSVPALAAFLTDPDLAHPARIGLEALSCPAAGTALIEALPKVKGDLLAGVVSTLGAKRVAAAAPALAKLIPGAEPVLGAAVLNALGQIGTEQAARELASAKVAAGLERDLARARIRAASTLAGAGNLNAAAAQFKELYNAEGQPAAIRVAAFEGLAGTWPREDAARLIIRALEGEDSVMRAAAVKAFALAEEARGTVADHLPGLQPRAQLLLLGMLADAPTVAARKPLLQVAKATKDPAVLAATLDALATHGKADDVALFADYAAKSEDPVKSAARRGLQRLSGPGVDAALLRVVESGDAARRGAVMAAIPARNLATATPVLSRMLRGTDTGAALDAARTLGEMSGTAQLKDLAGVLTRTTNEDLRATSQEAIKTICTKAEDKSACERVVLAQLGEAETPQARAGLLPLTLYTAGDDGFNAVLKALQDSDAGVRDAAFRTLVAWPDGRAAKPLAQFAEANKETTQAVIALRDGCLRLAEMEELPAAERAGILQEVARVARRADEKRRAVSLMGQVPALSLLEALPALAEDAGLRAEAMTSAAQLAGSLGAVYPTQSRAALEALKKLADTPELQQVVERGLKAVQNAGMSPEGYIIGWLLSGPYTAPDMDGAALFDVAFEPEKDSATAKWQPLVAPRNGMVDLAKLMPGGNRVAYLKAVVQSEQDQPATLELGSDDGVKAWLNGALVHGNNASRPVAAGQDKAKVNLRRGDNVLLLKITQGGGDWGAIARFRAADGKALPGIMVGSAKP